MKHVRLLLLAVVLAATPAWAQYGAPPKRLANAGNVILTREDKTTKTFPTEPDAKLVDVSTGAVITPATIVREGMKIKDTKTGEVFTVKVPDKYLTLSLYFASFGIAGPIQQGDGSFEGGTDEVQNPLIAVDAGLPIPRKYGSLSVGGWYFPSPRGSSNDLYQIQARYSRSKTNPVGFQLAYLNSENDSAPGLTYHVTYTLSSAKFTPDALPWSVEFGAGFLNSRGDQAQADGTVRHRNTYNTSFFVNGSLGVTKNVAALASLWVVRERNQDLTRLALGVSYRF